jgi:hypothetical protein
MERINWGRMILGGIVAGIVGDILGYVVDAVILAPQWADGMKALGKTDYSNNQLLGFDAVGLMLGLATVWLYASIRPRYGAGPKTAVIAGLAIWVVGTLLPNAVFMSINGLFPTGLTVMTTAGGIVELVVGALAGCALYQEAATSLKSMQARA